MDHPFSAFAGWMLLPVLGVSFAGCGGAAAFERLAAGGLPRAGARLVLDEEEWDRLWAALYGAGARPAVDWERYAVLGVFLGERPTGGYRVRVERVEAAAGKLRVTVRTTSPGPGDVVTMAFTYPGELVRVDRSHLAAARPLTVEVYDQTGRLLFTSSVRGG